MNNDVLARLTLDEAVASAGIEPLDGPRLLHGSSLLRSSGRTSRAGLKSGLFSGILAENAVTSRCGDRESLDAQLGDFQGLRYIAPEQDTVVLQPENIKSGAHRAPQRRELTPHGKVHAKIRYQLISSARVTCIPCG